jgi:hypothetical protein
LAKEVKREVQIPSLGFLRLWSTSGNIVLFL